jgi:hypothetical protein
MGSRTILGPMTDRPWDPGAAHSASTTTAARPKNADVPSKAKDVADWIGDDRARARAAQRVEAKREGGERQTVLDAIERALA